ncbi:O-antigen ligase family protein [Chitinophagaceae bacterium MMS25-I14]
MPFIYATVSIMLVAFAWIAYGNYKERLGTFIRRKEYWPWMAYFLLHAAGTAYSHNTDQALFDLQSKLSFLVLPLLIGAGIPLDKDRIEKIFMAFVSGITATSIYCMGKAVYLYNQTHDTKYFFYHTLIKGLEANAVYVAWYTAFSLSVLLLFKWNRFSGRLAKAIRILYILLQVLFFILLSSRMLLVVFPLVLIFVFLYQYFAQRRFSALKLVVITGVAALCAAGIGLTDNPIRQRYQDMLHTDVSSAYIQNYNQQEPVFTNLTVRLFVWRMGMDEIKDRKLWLKGCGNGDVALLLNARMKAAGIPGMDGKIYPRSDLYNINLHNMYLQSLMMLGIPGLLCFLIIVMLPFFLMRKMRYGIFYFLFHFISVLFMLQEAALQTQAGIIYFTFFSVVFINNYYTSVKKTKQASIVN